MIAALRTAFRAPRCHHIAILDVIAGERAARLRALIDAAGFEPFYEPDRGRCEMNRDLVDQPLFDALGAVAEQLVERPLGRAHPCWMRLRHRDYGLLKGSARDRTIADDHLEVTLDFSARALAQAAIVYSDGRESWVVAQVPCSLVIAQRDTWLFRYEEYLNRDVGDAVIYRLRLSLPFA